MSLKVMFIYPNSRGMNMLPPSVGILLTRRAEYHGHARG